VETDLDTLITALYVKTDDEIGGTRWLGRPPRLTGSGLDNNVPAGRRVVAGVDGPAASIAALIWAAREARLRRAELIAVYAWDAVRQCRAAYAAQRGLPSREEARAAAASVLSVSVHAAFGQDPPPGLRAEVAEGRPEQVLSSRAAGAGMLVLGCTR
jgi:nucleotide-binding universal stress UspA family protein